MKFDKSKFDKTEVNGIMTYTYKDENAYTSSGDITLKTLKQVDDHRSAYLEDATKIASEIAEHDMDKNKKINKVIFEFPFSTSKRGNVNITVDRSKTFASVNGGDPVTKSKITVAVTDPYNKVSKSRLKDIEARLTKKLLG